MANKSGKVPLVSGIHMILVVGYGWSKVDLATNSAAFSSRLTICTLLLYSSTKEPNASLKKLFNYMSYELDLERKRKLVSKSEEIVQLANNPLMAGLGHSKTAFNLFEAQIIPSLLNNAESWIGITPKQIKDLQDFQDIFTRKVLHLAPSTTKALINWDVGMMPMKWRVAMKKLQSYKSLTRNKWTSNRVQTNCT